jgi:hypothetical protein
MTTPTAFCTRKPISWSLFASLVLALWLILLNAACKPKLHLQGGQVHGFVVSEFANVAGAPVTQIALPDVFVYLKNTVSGKRSAKVKTNELGHFATNNEKPGTYQVCAEASGFLAICDPKVISIVAGTVVLDHNLVINPEGESHKDESCSRTDILAIRTTSISEPTSRQKCLCTMEAESC